jgi:DNA-directed RNA polymerase beta' subunit
MGQVDDSIIGSAELTRSSVWLDKYHAMLLFQNTTFLPSFGDMNNTTDLISGRDCVSKLFVDTPINFTRGTEWYDPNIAAYMKYDPTEIKVKIEKGRLISGVLDKKNIGKGSSGGIYHIITNDFGAEKTLEVMYNMQQVAVAYLMQTGFTIGVIDLLIPDETKVEVERIASDIINKSRLITEELHSGEIIPPIGKTIEEFYEERQINILRIFDDFNEPILRAINTDTNNLFKLIQFGSKGKKPDMFNMMTVIGQKLINGERIRQKFGYKRTLPCFKRFDSSPESRGYITNSYLGGMTSSEYVFNAMAARFDLISRALSTSITGEQMRTSVKNLESTVCNNFRQSTKGSNVIQFAYGEDYLDPRRVERVKFPTIMISDEEFSTDYSHKDYPEFFAAMTADRKQYRDIFLNLERINVKDFLSDERNMPVAIERVIRNVRTDHEDFLATGEQPKDLDTMVKHVENLCESIPYVLVNEIQEKAKTAIPDQIKAAAWLLIVLIRSYLHPNALVKMGLTMNALKIITDRIRIKYAKALIDPGTAVGIIAAQSFSAPLTQYMLDASHRSASGGTTKSGAVGAKEIFSAREANMLCNPTMLIPMIESVRNDRDRVQEIANSIEMMTFRQFVTSTQVFFEKYGEPVHSKTKHEIAMFDEFSRNNPLLKPPGDLSKWCIRFVLNKTSMILKNMPLELMINKLRDSFPDIFIVYSPENANIIIVRVYMKMVMFKGVIETADILEISKEIMKLNIRGVDRITNTTVVKMMRTMIQPDGSMVRDENQWGILTSGTNLRGVFKNVYVDRDRVHTDAIQEIARVFGIEAARQRIISGMANLAISNINSRHYMTYADEMTYTGKVTNIERSGLKTREGNNVLLRAGTSHPISAIEDATINSMDDAIGGMTAAFLVGAVPAIGSIYNSFHVNQEFVRQNVKKPEDLIDELFI